MPFYFSLLQSLALSLALHLAMVFGPLWLGTKQPPPPSPRIEAQLVPVAMPPATQTAETISTETTPVSPPPPSTAPVPKKIAGAALRRAQGALSEHLLYPPEAVRQGLEGEVVLLLKLAADGRIVGIEIASSSGHALLDQAAISAAGNIGALPGNPPQTLLPVSFRLQ